MQSIREEARDRDRAMVRDSKAGFGEFLSGPAWDWYTTHTFKAQDMGRAEGDKHYFAWMNSLKLACRVRQLPPPFYCRVTEYQKRGTLHYHSLIGGVDGVRRMLFKNFWELHGFARVVKYQPGRGANFYVGKYLTKNDSNIIFSHNIKKHLTIE